MKRCRGFFAMAMGLASLGLVVLSSIAGAALDRETDHLPLTKVSIGPPMEIPLEIESNQFVEGESPWFQQDRMISVGYAGFTGPNQVRECVLVSNLDGTTDWYSCGSIPEPSILPWPKQVATMDASGGIWVAEEQQGGHLRYYTNSGGLVSSFDIPKMENVKLVPVANQEVILAGSEMSLFQYTGRVIVSRYVANITTPVWSLFLYTPGYANSNVDPQTLTAKPYNIDLNSTETFGLVSTLYHGDDGSQTGEGSSQLFFFDPETGLDFIPVDFPEGVDGNVIDDNLVFFGNNDDVYTVARTVNALNPNTTHVTMEIRDGSGVVVKQENNFDVEHVSALDPWEKVVEIPGSLFIDNGYEVYGFNPKTLEPRGVYTIYSDQYMVKSSFYADSSSRLWYFGVDYSGKHINPLTVRLFPDKPISMAVDHNYQALPGTLQGIIGKVLWLSAPSFAGAQPVGVVARKMGGGDNYEVRMREWDYLDGYHNPEEINFALVPEGSYILEDIPPYVSGVRFTAETLDLPADSDYPQWHTVNFFETLPGTPSVFVSLVSENDPQPVATRIRNITPSSFEVKLSEEKALTGSGHASETISYVAIYVPGGYDVPFQTYSKNSFTLLDDLLTLQLKTASVNSNWATPFLSGTPWSHPTSFDSPEFMVQEEDSTGDGIGHMYETVDMLAKPGMDSVYFDAMQTTNGTDPCTLRRRTTLAIP